MTETPWNDNPFASPSVIEPAVVEYEHLDLPKSEKVPTPLILALLLLALQFGLWIALIASRPRMIDLVAMIVIAIPGLMLLPAVVGILRHGRLSYRYLKLGSLLLAPLTFTISASFLILLVTNAKLFPRNQLPLGAYGLFVFTAASIGTLVALDRRSVKTYVRLRCPRCGTFRTRAADVFFARAKCKNCRVTW